MSKTLLELYWQDVSRGRTTKAVSSGSKWLDNAETVDIRAIAYEVWDETLPKANPGHKQGFAEQAMRDAMNYRVAPPFKQAWFESITAGWYRHNRLTYSPGAFMVTALDPESFVSEYNNDTKIAQYAMLTQAKKFPPDLARDYLAIVSPSLDARNETLRRVQKMMRENFGTKWLMEIVLLEKKPAPSTSVESQINGLHETENVSCDGFMILAIDAEGRWMDSVDWMSPGMTERMSQNYNMEADDLRWPELVDGFVIGGCLPVLHALNLLNCKNITLDTKRLPAPVRKKREKAGKAIVEWKRLVVEVGKDKRRYVYDRRSTPDEPSRAFHVCRGHFREYTNDAPLFGKYVGRYWIPQHSRGSKDLGEVRKVYDVQEVKK